MNFQIRKDTYDAEEMSATRGLDPGAARHEAGGADAGGTCAWSIDGRHGFQAEQKSNSQQF